MEPINDYMMKDHQEIDAIFMRSRDAAATSDWIGLQRNGESFLGRIGRHIEMEEELLFPTFDETTGMSSGGPTETMRSEHAQMQPMFAQMCAAIDAKNAAQYLQVSQTLNELLQQHNMKEEQMMYPMLDRALGGAAAKMVVELRKRALAPSCLPAEAAHR